MFRPMRRGRRGCVYHTCAAPRRTARTECSGSALRQCDHTVLICSEQIHQWTSR